MTEEPSRSAFDARREAKRLLRCTRSGSLATLGQDGAPLVSLVTCATMPDGTPILLLSQLAAHTRNLINDRRGSLLLAQTGKGDPLAHPRLTLVGRAVPLGADDALARRRFLARNPKSALYADFPDFGFWTLVIDEAHLNGGFARAARLAAAEILTDRAACREIAEGEEAAVAHMNADHRTSIADYAVNLAKLPARDWRLSGIDPDGVDLVAGDLTGRIVFPAPVATRQDLRRILVDLAEIARSRPA